MERNIDKGEGEERGEIVGGGEIGQVVKRRGEEVDREEIGAKGGRLTKESERGDKQGIS